MKTRVLLLSLFVTLSFCLSSQITEGDMAMSQGVKNSLSVVLKGADQKKAEKIWRSYAGEFGDVKRDKKAKEYSLLNVIVPSIDRTNPVNVYAKFDEFDHTTRAYFWVVQEDQFVNSSDHEELFTGTKIFLADFAVQVEKDVVNDEIEEEEKVLKKLQKDLEKLQKKNKDLHKDIEKAREQIRKAESEIERNIDEQADKQMEIEEQKNKISKVSDKMNRIKRKV